MAIFRPYQPFLGPIAQAIGTPARMTVQDFAQRFDPEGQDAGRALPVASVPRRPIIAPAPTPMPEAPQTIGSMVGRAGNNAGGFLGSDAALALAAGILEGGTDGEAIGRGFNYALQARAAERDKRAKLAETEKQNNATVNYLKAAGAPQEIIDLAQQGYGSDAISLFKSQKSADGQKIEIQMPGEHTDKMREELDKREAGMMGDTLDQGVKAMGIKRDMDTLSALVDVAPQNPITGRLAIMFPGFSTAGDAFNSIVYRLAPSLRAPGSGSTSDIEYEGFLKAVPSLRNTPGANKLIIEIMSNKAQIDIDRHDTIEAYQNGDIDAKEMRRQMKEINSRSIVTEEFRNILKENYGGEGYDRASEFGKKSPRLDGTTKTGVEFQVQ